MAQPPALKQHGIALITVMVSLLLCSVVVLASARTGLLQEMQTANHSDELRAQAAAEALIKDAEIDIRGVLPDGRLCRAAPYAPDQAIDGFIGCRERGRSLHANAPYFPQDLQEYDEVRALAATFSTPCRNGICVPSSMDAFAHIEDSMPAMVKFGATYGQFTRVGLASQGATGNPLLSTNPPRAWYWIEVFRYEMGPDTLATNNRVSPDPTRPFVYRITAVALGLKPGTRAVVKSFFVPHPSSQIQ